METSFWALAIMGTTVFVLRLGMMFLGFGDHDYGDAGDVGDVDVGGEFDFDGQTGHGADSMHAFTFLSLQSLATFFMGAGWMGLVALKSWSLDNLPATLCAAGFGVFCVFLLGKLLQQAMHLESSGTLDKQQALGKIGKVYARIPVGGQGQIQIEVQGRLVTLAARSADGELSTGATVLVEDIDGAGVLVVSPSY